MPFVVDDILLTYIVLPYGRRLLNENREQFYNWLDGQLGKAGKKFVKSLRKDKRPDNAVLEAVGNYVVQNHGTAYTLAPAAFAAQLETAIALPAIKGDEQFLTAFRDSFLTPVFEMVKSLAHPAVVPGFLTGADWLTAIDVRVPSGEELEKVRVFPRIEKTYPKSEVIPARIQVWTAPGPLGVTHWRPRIWLVRPMDGELARELNTTPGELADALNKRASDEYGTSQQFAEALEHQAFVTEITRHHVIVQRARWVSFNSPYLEGESSRIPWAESTAGAVAMLTALARQLGDQQQENERWIQAVKNWASEQ